MTDRASKERLTDMAIKLEACKTEKRELLAVLKLAYKNMLRADCCTEGAYALIQNAISKNTEGK